MWCLGCSQTVTGACERDDCPIRLAAQAERMEEALQRIVAWSEAYPPSVFPEPDLKRAADLLKAGGITLDAVSAHAMRHVVEGVGQIAKDALQR